ncbi:putative leucine-rich repeat receptor-like protein kinase [Cinnamomum micranthum f. kanehirae]|uniref:Putative leucine-rich repeat receptor-like protein kinase n=1 Tax=Cinnamomum micranthum f. kanehirae TaxID=337451 RepID=A0A443PM16_9MAGN|nr:putative leucine-rich repeat receptor-like protein kinase [Cinnamomum micranthum f. kanehirae]
MFLLKSIPFLLHFWVGFLILCTGSLKFNSCVEITTTTTGCLERERQALIHFKQGLKNPSNRLSSWVGDNCCKWAGIHCSNKTGHVVKLSLRGPSELQSSSSTFNYDIFEAEIKMSSISGEINPSLLELKYLKHLDLSINCFGGKVIPKFIGSFKNLRYLNLSGSGFGGRVPHEIRNLSTLIYLDLNNYRRIRANTSDGISYYSFGVSTYDLHVDRLDWLSGPSFLQYLDMGSVNLSMAADWQSSINMLPSILNLHLSYCQLPNISTSLPHLNLTSLSTLDLSENWLGPQLPTWVFNSSRLVSLDLHYNDFSYPISTALGNLCNLQILKLRENHFNGEINRFKESFKGCIKSNLEDLDLGGNGLSGHLPDWLGQFINLKSLSLSYNSLTGPIPPSLERLSSLRELSLYDNSLSCPIPPFLGKLSSLTKLYLYYNSLSDPIPPSLGRLSSLRELDLSYNSLSGPIPPSLGRLSSLRVLNLYGNSLFGPFPPSLGRLPSLSMLLLDSNKLNGSIPESLGQLSNLEYLSLSNNSFKGILTEANFSNLIKLKDLEISSTSLVFNVSSNWVPPFQLENFIMNDCKLGPKFPPWLQTQKQLSYLSLSNASISDTISNIFQILPSNIQFLDLSSNSIFDSITNSNTGKTTNLLYLSLSSNHLKGSIPLSICQMRNLTYLSFSNNQLTHEIPRCLGDLEFLNTLILDNNVLYGGIPSSISHLSQLTSLHLSKNKLSGELPPSMKNCTWLKTLDLGENGFSGKIPNWIGERLSFLKFLILRSNKLHGSIPPHLSLLSELQVLDLSQNNLSGTIPESFGNFSAMTVANRTNVIIYNGGEFSGVESIWVFWKGVEYEYSRTVSLVININLSGNDLHGEIPKGITHLLGLQSLNLSRNRLTGTIPEDMNDFQRIESLDLSWNQLSRAIPHGFSYLTFLSHLNLSHNNFSGRIPSSNQLDTLNDSSIYMGNPLLCGPPLLNQCPPNGIFPDSQPLSDGDKEAKDELEIQLFYICMGPGFVVGFWVVCGILLFKRSWRVAYYNFFDDMEDRFYVAIARKLAKFKKNKGLQGNRGLPSTP